MVRSSIGGHHPHRIDGPGCAHAHGVCAQSDRGRPPSNPQSTFLFRIAVPPTELLRKVDESNSLRATGSVSFRHTNNRLSKRTRAQGVARHERPAAVVAVRCGFQWRLERRMPIRQPAVQGRPMLL